MPWIFDLGANVTCRQNFWFADLRVKLSVYNLLNQQRVVQVEEQLVTIPNPNSEFGYGTAHQTPRYALPTFNLDFRALRVRWEAAQRPPPSPR